MPILPSNVSAICRLNDEVSARWGLAFSLGCSPHHSLLFSTMTTGDSCHFALSFHCCFSHGTTPLSPCLYQKVRVQNNKNKTACFNENEIKPNFFGQWRTSYPVSLILFSCLVYIDIWACSLLGRHGRDVILQVYSAWIWPYFMLKNFCHMFVKMKIYWALSSHPGSVRNQFPRSISQARTTFPCYSHSPFTCAWQPHSPSFYHFPLPK